MVQQDWKRIVLVSLIVTGIGSAWVPTATAGVGCEAPYISYASDHTVGQHGIGYVVSVRNPEGCRGVRLWITGELPSHVIIQYSNPTPNNALATVFVVPGFPPVTLNMLATATDGHHTTTFPLVLRGGRPDNETPTLGSVSDLLARVGQVTSYSVVLTDADGNLPISPEVLTIAGLPSNARVDFTHVEPYRIAARVSLYPEPRDVGIYRVSITGIDQARARVSAEQRILIQ